jgi:pyruvyl transferase EpsO
LPAETLWSEIIDVLRGFVALRSPCALVGFPNHDNVGDSAIWCGTLAVLDELGVAVVYVCDAASYSSEALAAALPDGVILLAGGGNFGDLWPTEQDVRERVLADFPDRRVVQLPQSLHFEDRRALDRARSIVDRHGELILFWRERQSLELAQESFAAPHFLCPDLAFALDRPALRRQPEWDILWLMRDDKESCNYPFPECRPPDARLDWPQALAAGSLWSAAHLEAPPASTGADPSLYAALAAARLEQGCRFLANARVVVTDRLHGHVLALLLGLPHVLMDNSYGKVRSFHETWTRDCDLVHWAETPAQAESLAAGLVAEVRS